MTPIYIFNPLTRIRDEISLLFETQFHNMHFHYKKNERHQQPSSCSHLIMQLNSKQHNNTLISTSHPTFHLAPAASSMEMDNFLDHGVEIRI